MAAIALCKLRVFFCCRCLGLTCSLRVNECPTQRPHRPPGQPPAHTTSLGRFVCTTALTSVFYGTISTKPPSYSVVSFCFSHTHLCREDLLRETSGKLWPRRRGDFSHLYQWVPHIRGFNQPQYKYLPRSCICTKCVQNFFSCLCSGNNTAQQPFTQLHAAL